VVVIKTKDMTLIAALVAILVVAQFAFSFVVGVQLVFPLLIIYTYNLGYKKAFILNLVFILVRFLMGLPFLTVFLWFWTFNILIALAHIVNKSSRGNEYLAAGFTLFYFVLFGFLCGVQNYFITEVPIYVYWLQGFIPDLLGGITGFVAMLVLLKPLSSVITNFYHKSSPSLS